MSPKSLRLARRAGRPSRVAGLATLVMLAAGMLIGSALGYTGIRLPGGYGYGYGHSCVTSDRPTQTATTAAMTSGTGPTPPPPPTAPPASASRCNDPRPQADFAVTPTSPSAGSLVHVDAYRSQGVEITYAWDLDEDGTFGEEGETGVRPPAFRFTTPGAHAIALRITDSAGRVSRSTQHFQVRADNVRPVVGMARLTPTGPSTNEPAQLVVGAVDPDGEVVSVEAAWEGGTDFSPVPRHQQVANAFVAPHTYTTPGQRKIVVRATDDAGGVATQTVDVHVHDGNRAPMLSVYANTTTPRVGRAIGMYANSSDSDGRIVKLQWDFEGDGTIDKTVEGDAVFSQVSHTYETADEATVVAIATDDDGATSKATQRIRPQATNTPPSVNFNSTSGQPRVNESLTLSAYGSDEDDPYTGGGVVEYAWDLDGDGTYEEANTGPNLTSRPKTFTTQGAHLVRVRVKDTDGAYGYAVQAFNVGPANIAPRISTLFAETATPTVDKPVKLNVDGWDPDGRPGPMGMGEPITYTWDLDGDGAYDDATTESVGGSTTTFVPAQAGSRRVGVRATDADGATDAVHRTITIRAAEQSSGFAPEVELRPTRKSAAVNRPVQFNAYATDADGDQLTYSWDVDGDTIFGDDVDGDGTFDADDQTSAATVSFPATGEHPVRVRVSDGTNAADALALLPVHATNLRPTGYVNGNDRAFPGDSVSLYVSANDEDGSVARYEWDLDGDGTFGEQGTSATAGDEPDVTHAGSATAKFTTAGEKVVVARVTDDAGDAALLKHAIRVAEAAANRRPTARIQLSPLMARKGKAVTLSGWASDFDSTQGGSYAWDLDGDGEFAETGTAATAGDEPTGTGMYSTLQQTYQSVGPRTVRFRYTDSGGASDTETLQFTVGEGNREPIVDLYNSTAVLRPGGQMQLSGYPSDPDGRIVEYAWETDGDGDFDDVVSDQVSYGQQITFPKAGRFEVGLKVTDDDGATAFRTMTVVVEDAKLTPYASIMLSGTPIEGEPLGLYGYGSDQDCAYPCQLTYAWDLDDDDEFGEDGEKGQQVSRTFATRGSHPVALRVTDADGQTHVIERDISVHSKLPVASFTHENPVDVDENVTFTSTGSDPDGGTLVKREWDLDDDGDFGEAGEPEGASASRSFTRRGSYYVGHRVTDDDGDTMTSYHAVFVECATCPTASFTWSPEDPQAGDDVTFTSASHDDVGITDAQWDLDDDGDFGEDGTNGQPDERAAKPTWSFEAGYHHVSLHVSDADGHTDTRTALIHVAPSGPRPPVVNATWTPQSPLSGQEVTFDASTSTPGANGGAELTDYAWDFDGNGTTDATGVTAKRTFTTSGFRAVRLTVTDAADRSSTRTFSVEVQNRKPVAAISASKTDPQTKESVTLNGAGSSDPDGSITQYEWDTDNNGTFDVTGFDKSSITVKYDTPGTRTVKLRVSDNQFPPLTDEKTIELTVRNRAPVAEFTFAPAAPAVDETVTFTAAGTDADGTIASNGWAFDLNRDGDYDDAQDATATGATATRAFTEAGTYKVRLTVTDDGGATHAQERSVRVGNEKPVPQISASKTDPLSDEEITLSGEGSTDPDGDSTKLTYTWELTGDGKYDDRSGKSIKHKFAQPGTRTVGVRVTDADGASATKTLDVVVGNRAPQASFYYDPSFVKAERAVKFVSTSTDPENSTLTYRWTFAKAGADTPAAGEFTADRTITRTFATGDVGRWTARLEVKDAHGGTSTSEFELEVHEDNTAPSVYVGAQPSSGRVGRAATFRASAWDTDGDAMTYEFDVDGDGAYGETGDEAKEGDEPSGTVTDGTASVTRTFTTAGTKVVSVRVSDTRGATSSASVQYAVSAENTAPQVWAYANPSRVRTGSEVALTASAWDTDDSSYDPERTPSYDDGIAKVEWDLDGDGKFGETGADAAEGDEPVGEPAEGESSVVRRTFAAGGERTVHVRATDEGGATGERTLTIDVRDGNTAPDVHAYLWPTEPTENQMTYISGWASDADWDTVTYKWDLDGDGIFAETGAAATAGDEPTTSSFSRQFATKGKRRFTVLADDGQGGTDKDVVEFTVVNSPPKAFLKAPVAVEQGEEFGVEDQSTDPGAGGGIASRAFDLDGDGDFDDGVDVDADGKKDAKQPLRFDDLGTRTLRVRVTDTDDQTAEHSVVVSVVKPSASGVGVPVPDKQTSSGGFTIAPEVQYDPGSGKSTIRLRNSDVGQFDPDKRCVPLEGELRIRTPDGTRIGNIRLSFRYNGNTEYLPLGLLGDELYRWKIKCATRGAMFVMYDLTGPDPDNPGQETTTPVEYEMGTIELIDPQGVVYDRSKYEEKLAALGTTPEEATEEQKVEARATAAITGARVVLQRLNPDTGQYQSVPSGSPLISPSINPQITGGDGLFKWDVDKGTWRVKVSRRGYVPVETEGAVIPPPKLDMHVALEKVAAPEASLTLDDDEVFRGQDVAATSTSKLADGSDPDREDWDLDADGDYDDGTGESRTKSFSTLGDKEIRVRALDLENPGAADPTADDNVVTSDTASKTLKVVNRLPTATIGDPAGTLQEGQNVTFGVTDSVGADAAFGDAVKSRAWAVDGDAFTAGTGTTLTRTYAPGAHTVKVKVTDMDGGEAIATRTFSITPKPEEKQPEIKKPGEKQPEKKADPVVQQPVPPTPPAPPVQEPRPPAPPALSATSAGVARTTLRKLLAKGLPVPITCSATCAVDVRIVVDRKTAKKLRLKSTQVGSGRGTLAGGKGQVVARLTAKAKKAMKRQRKVKLSFVVTVVGADGKPVTVRVPAVTLR